MRWDQLGSVCVGCIVNGYRNKYFEKYNETRVQINTQGIANQ